jgi:hypothetical protein
MPVRIVYKDDAKPDAWRSDWPVTAAGVKPSDKPAGGAAREVVPPLDPNAPK